MRSEASPKILRVLAESWITSPAAPATRAGLQLLPAAMAPDEPGQPLYALLHPLHVAPEAELREALIACLSALAELGQPAVVLELLNDWAQRPNPNTWVITHALSAAWAQAHSRAAVDILNRLVDQTGLIRPIVRALARHQPGE